MKHAGPQALAALAPLNAAIRTRPGLEERRPGIFYRRGRAFLHFHEDAAGLFADLRGSQDWERFRVVGAEEQGAFLCRLDALLHPA